MASHFGQVIDSAIFMIHKPGPILFQNLHSSRVGEWFGQSFMNIGIDGDED